MYIKVIQSKFSMTKTHKYLLAPISLAGITVFSGAFLLSPSSIATDDNSAVDQVSITVPISCTLSGTGMTSHNASIPNGTYTADIGTTTLTAFCNDNSGFSIYATGYTGNEIGATNSNKLVGTSTSNNATIDTGTATSAGNPDTSNWAMKLTATSSPTPTYPITIDNGFGSYSSVPNSYTKVAHRASGTDVGTNAEGSTLTTTYGAYISKTQPADTYSGQVIYTLVHPESEEPLQPQPAVAGKIVYHANASTATGQMGNQSASDGNTVTLRASNFKRDGYGFAGWSDKYDYATNANANFYGPNQTITVPTGTTANGLSLYAVWIKSTGSMQTDATTACNGLTQAPTPTNGTATLASVTALTDERDNNTYAIAKLADGKCWTIENLRLADKDSSNSDIILSSTNTHNPSVPFTNTWWYSSGDDNNSISASHHLSATTDPTSTAWCTTNSSNCDDQSMLATNNTTLFTNNTSSSYSASSNVYSYGNYYNWYSATAGHGKYGDNYGSDYTAPGDICPAGWHLPTTGTSSGEYYNLNYAINDNNNTTDSTASQKIRTYPNNFVYSGYVGGSSVSLRWSNGYYWSVSGGNSWGAYDMYFQSNYVDLGTTLRNKYSGRMVRCIAGV